MICNNQSLDRQKNVNGEDTINFININNGIVSFVI